MLPKTDVHNKNYPTYVVRDGTTQGLMGATTPPPPQKLLKKKNTSTYINKKNFNFGS